MLAAASAFDNEWIFSMAYTCCQFKVEPPTEVTDVEGEGDLPPRSYTDPMHLPRYTTISVQMKASFRDSNHHCHFSPACCWQFKLGLTTVQTWATHACTHWRGGQEACPVQFQSSNNNHCMNIRLLSSQQSQAYIFLTPACWRFKLGLERRRIGRELDRPLYNFYLPMLVPTSPPSYDYLP